MEFYKFEYLSFCGRRNLIYVVCYNENCQDFGDMDVLDQFNILVSLE